MTTSRHLVYNFFRLSYPTRMKLLLDLGLLEDEDQGLADSELILRTIRRAKERGLLEALDEGIRTKATDGNTSV